MRVEGRVGKVLVAHMDLNEQLLFCPLLLGKPPGLATLEVVCLLILFCFLFGPHRVFGSSSLIELLHNDMQVHLS